MCVLYIPGKRADGCPQTPAANSSIVTMSAVATAEEHKHRRRHEIKYYYIVFGL